MVRTFFVGILIVAGMFMTLLDTTIVDIALPHMMSTFHARTDEIQWVIISYMVASAIAMPVVGWLGGKIGHRNTYILGISLFTFMSAVCGMAPNLNAMILGRIFQGIGEGLSVPMTMTLLFEIFPPKSRGVAMGMFALGATFGPSLGPTLGGYITEHFNWRWIFYVNLLPGILVVYFLTLLLENDERNSDQPLDLLGLILLGTSLSSLIVSLSKGNDWGWSSFKTVSLLYASFVSFAFFLFWEVKRKNPLVRLELFRFKNFRYPVISLTVFGMGVYASYFLLPLYLEKLRDFPTITAGEILFWPSMGTGVFSMVAGFLMDRKVISKKTSILIGTAVFTFGTLLQQKLNLEMSELQIVLYLMPWGIGMGFFFPALSQISLGNFKGELLRQASSLQNLLRLVGGSVGTAISTHILISSQQYHFVRLTEKVSYQMPQVEYFLNKAGAFFAYFRSLPLSELASKSLLGNLFVKHAFWHSFADAFFFATLCGCLTFLFATLVEDEDEETVGGFDFGVSD